MMVSNYQMLTRTALLLALTLLFQSLRMVIPIPLFISVFIIGTLVNACLLIASQSVGVKSGVAIAVLAPVVAWFQQLLALPIFIIPVGLGNIIYIMIFQVLIKKGPVPALSIAAIAKAATLYLSFKWLFALLDIPSSITTGIMLVMSWPQIVTAFLGGMMAIVLLKRLKMIA